jgi:addiction module HigA family antidote
MTDITARRSRKRRPTHPGALLNDTVLPALDRTKAELARLLGMSRQSLYAILAGTQPVTPTTAVKLGKLCGNGPELWMSMQAAYDLWGAEREVDVTGIPTLKSA